MILISACLAGKKCRYDGGSAAIPDLVELVNNKKAIIACPECLGGLKTPRKQAEIIGGDGFDVLEGKAKVYNIDKEDMTESYVLGAQKFLGLAQSMGASKVILKSKSPSCGVKKIYDGNFLGQLVLGCGVCAALLIKNDIVVEER